MGSNEVRVAAFLGFAAARLARARFRTPRSIDRPIEPLLVELVLPLLLRTNGLIGHIRGWFVLGRWRRRIDRVAVGVDHRLILRRRVPDLVVTFALPVGRRGLGREGLDRAPRDGADHEIVEGARRIAPVTTQEGNIISDAVLEVDEEFIEDLEIDREPTVYEIGDQVVYPHHGAGKVLKKEMKEVLGEKREYLTIKILHNDMTVMVPCCNADKAGLRRVIGEDDVKKVLTVLRDDVSQMPKNWNRRFKHNREKIKTGDVFELAEVVRNLAIRESEKGLSTGEKQMYTRAKKILASEFMYALDKDEDGAETYLDELLEERFGAAKATA